MLTQLTIQLLVYCNGCKYRRNIVYFVESIRTVVFQSKWKIKREFCIKSGCLCGKIIFEIIRGIQENIFANKAVLR